MPDLSYSADSPTDPDNGWWTHVPALNAAAASLTRVTTAWDPDMGHRLAQEAAAWNQIHVFLDHGLEVLAGVRATARGTDYLDSPISADLQRLHGIESTLAEMAEVRDKWRWASAQILGPPEVREFYYRISRALRNAEMRPLFDRLERQGGALARAAEHLAHRLGDPEPEAAVRVQAARNRSNSSAQLPAASPSTPPTPTAPPQLPPPRRSR